MKKEDYLIKVMELDTIWDENPCDVHLRNIGPTDHLTVCGMDGGVSDDTHIVVSLSRTDKLTCPTCKVFYDNRKFLNIKKSWIGEC